MSKSKMSRPERRERKKVTEQIRKSLYLKEYNTKEWNLVRKVVFERDNFTCKGCDKQESLQCHHNMYVKNKRVWDYDISIFDTLCTACHEEFHDKIKGKDLVVTIEVYNKFVRENRQGKADFTVLKTLNRKAKIKSPRPKKVIKKVVKTNRKPTATQYSIYEDKNKEYLLKNKVKPKLTPYQKALQHKRELEGK